MENVTREMVTLTHNITTLMEQDPINFSDLILESQALHNQTMKFRDSATSQNLSDAITKLQIQPGI